MSRGVAAHVHRRYQIAGLVPDEDPHGILPVQHIASTPFSHGPGSGERRLLVALLLDAVRCIVQPTEQTGGKAQRARDLVWLAEEADDVMAFRRICDVLELTPADVLRAVSRGTFEPAGYRLSERKFHPMSPGRRRYAGGHRNGLGVHRSRG